MKAGAFSRAGSESEVEMLPAKIGQLLATRPNHVWCADVRYIPMCRGLLYQATIMDWANRKVPTCLRSNMQDTGSCVAALEEELTVMVNPRSSTRTMAVSLQLRLHRSAARTRCSHQHGRPRPEARLLQPPATAFGSHRQNSGRNLSAEWKTRSSKATRPPGFQTWGASRQCHSIHLMDRP